MTTGYEGVIINTLAQGFFKRLLPRSFLGGYHFIGLTFPNLGLVPGFGRSFGLVARVWGSGMVLQVQVHPEDSFGIFDRQRDRCDVGTFSTLARVAGRSGLDRRVS